MGEPITTIPPFGDIQQLPGCAVSCGALYSANGACVPPGGPTAAASAYTACFCERPVVAAFSTGTAGPCDGACGPDGAGGMSSIADWFQGICDVKDTNTQASSGDAATTTTESGSSSGSNSGSKDSGDGGDWLSGHWQWVVMLAVLVVAIAGIWVGACIWRRRYLKRKDRQSLLSQKQSGSVKHPSWGPGVAATAAPGVYGPEAREQGVVAPSHAPPQTEKPSKKKKLAVSSRT